MDKIIAFILNENFIMQTAASVVSVVENASCFTKVNILCSEELLNEAVKMEKTGDIFSIKAVCIPEKYKNVYDAFENKNEKTPEDFYALELENLFPQAKRVLLLNENTIVRKDTQSMFKLDMKGNTIAAADIKEKCEFDFSAVLIDTHAIRNGYRSNEITVFSSEENTVMASFEKSKKPWEILGEESNEWFGYFKKTPFYKKPKREKFDFEYSQRKLGKYVFDESCPLVSVVMPVYNVEKYVERCMESVVSQTLKDIEIICVDDGSNDKSAEIIKNFAEKDGRIKIITEKNGGISYARNTGIIAARGKYIYFLDSDDFMNISDGLEKMYERAEKDGLDILYVGCKIDCECPELEERREKAAWYEKDRCFDFSGKGSEMLLYMAADNSFWVPQSTCFYSRRFIYENDLLFYEGILYEDSVYAMEAILKAEKTAFINDKVYCRYFRQGSIITSNNNCESIIGLIVNAALYFNYTEKCGAGEKQLSYIYKRCRIFLNIAAEKMEDLPDIEKQYIYHSGGLVKKYFILSLGPIIERNETKKKFAVYAAGIETRNAAIKNRDEKILRQNIEINSLKDKTEALQAENNRINIKLIELAKTVDELKNQHKASIEKIKSSVTFRTEETVLWLPKTVYRIFKHGRKNVSENRTDIIKKD